MRGRLRVAAAVTLVIGVAGGVALMGERGRMLFTTGDCEPPPGYIGGGYRCYTIGHIYAGLGQALVVLTVIASLILWRVSNRRPAASDLIE